MSLSWSSLVWRNLVPHGRLVEQNPVSLVHHQHPVCDHLQYAKAEKSLWNHVTVYMYLSVHVCTAVFLITNDSRRKCGRAHLGLYGCSLTTFGVGGSQVCGKARAYCLGHSHAFLGYHYREKVVTMWMVCSHHMRGHTYMLQVWRVARILLLLT